VVPAAGRTHELREALAARIDAIDGLHCYPSTTNFLLLATERVPAAALVAGCREHGVFVRDCASLSTRFGTRLVRTAVKDRGANTRIGAALAAATRAR
jgi:histidinol-phosphate/aromatic aminotransferase/cobyric acid decarboxylase-like protein